jgi:DNA-binding Xre family transcriptional regulator
MQIKIGELKVRASRGGARLTWDDIEAATGVRRPSLIAMNNGTAKQIRPEHLDALCKFFGVGVGDLLEAEEVELPLRMSIRPDRRKK